MSFTMIFAALALIGLLLVFGISYSRKGLKAAFINTGIAFAAILIVFTVVIYAIVGSM